MYAYGCRTFREVVSRLFLAWAAREGKTRWGDKTPQYVTQIPVLKQIFPDAKFIHVIRDGRDVALSLMKHDFGGNNIYTCARSWKHMVGMGRISCQNLTADQFLEVRYEELLAEPEKTMQHVCSFLDEPYTPAVLTPNRLPPRLLPRIVGQRQPLDISQEAIVSGNSQKWKRRMSHRQRVLFESVAGDLLDELGYETEGITQRVSVPERCWWECQSRVIETAKRLNHGNKSRWVPSQLKIRWAGWRSRYRRLRRRQ